MSDEPNKIPSKQTSSIPLKKETVRVTLKASDAPVAPAPLAPPTAPVIPKPPTPTVGPPRVSAPTVPMVAVPVVPSVPGIPSIPSPTSSAPPPAPTIPLKTAGPPMARPVAAPTIKLNSGTATGAPTVPLKTGPLVTPPSAPSLPGARPPSAANTIALPKATVQLAAPTQPLGTGSVAYTQMATFQSEDDEEEKPQTLVTVLSIFGFLAACGVLAFQCMSISIWEGWDKLFN